MPGWRRLDRGRLFPHLGHPTHQPIAHHVGHGPVGVEANQVREFVGVAFHVVQRFLGVEVRPGIRGWIFVGGANPSSSGEVGI